MYYPIMAFCIKTLLSKFSNEITGCAVIEEFIDNRTNKIVAFEDRDIPLFSTLLYQRSRPHSQL